MTFATGPFLTFGQVVGKIVDFHLFLKGDRERDILYLKDLNWGKMQIKFI